VARPGAGPRERARSRERATPRWRAPSPGPACVSDPTSSPPARSGGGDGGERGDGGDRSDSGDSTSEHDVLDDGIDVSDAEHILCTSSCPRPPPPPALPTPPQPQPRASQIGRSVCTRIRIAHSRDVVSAGRARSRADHDDMVKWHTRELQSPGADRRHHSNRIAFHRREALEMLRSIRSS
jgi:hypothetical protein